MPTTNELHYATISQDTEVELELSIDRYNEQRSKQ